MNQCQGRNQQPVCVRVYGQCYLPVWDECHVCGGRVDIQHLPDAYGANWGTGGTVDWQASACYAHLDEDSMRTFEWWRTRTTNPGYVPPPASPAPDEPRPDFCASPLPPTTPTR